MVYSVAGLEGVFSPSGCVSRTVEDKRGFRYSLIPPGMKIFSGFSKCFSVNGFQNTEHDIVVVAQLKMHE